MPEFKAGDRVRMAEHTGTVTEAGGSVTYVSWDNGCTRKESSFNLTLLEPLPTSGGITGNRPAVQSLRALNASFRSLRTVRRNR